MALLKVEKNELLLAIAAGGVNPFECQLEEHPRKRFSLTNKTSITHLPSGARFEVTRINDMYYSADPSGRPITWADVIGLARRWAGEITQPDFWASLTGYRDLFRDRPYDDIKNALFSADEQATISHELQEIKEYLKRTYKWSDEQIFRIEHRIDEAEKASRRIGRKDWLLLFSGTIFTLIVTDIITPDVAQHILMMVFHALKHLFEGDVRPIEGDPGTK